MADVARIAGVSISTVSHVVNETRQVSPVTRQLVLDAVRATGYERNSIARALARGGTNSIGFAVSTVANPYFGDLVGAVDRPASAAGYALLLGDSRDDPVRELQVVRALVGRRVDGLILSAQGDPAPVLDYLAKHRVPTVLVDRVRPGPTDQVGVENVESSASLVGHLTDRGHTRIGMVSGMPARWTSVERIQGYRLALRRAGLAYDPALVVPGNSVSEDACTAVKHLLDLPDPPTALFVADNPMTTGALRGLQLAGRQVPDDMAIVSFDDVEWADLFAPALTTLASPTGEIGVRAVGLLLARIADPDRSPHTVRPAPSLRHRTSCGC